MKRFFSKKRRGESSSRSITPFIGANVEVEENVETETNFNEDVRDPGLRKPIDEFDIAIRDQVRREYWSMGPCQVVGHTYPKTEFGTQLRSFQDVWYQKFVWLEYSVAKDACFCFWCYLFKPQDKASRYRADAFTKTGFSNWKKALDKFAEHVGNADSCHNNARMQIEAFKDQKLAPIYLDAWHVLIQEILSPNSTLINSCVLLLGILKTSPQVIVYVCHNNSVIS
ncbi:uncharacterized protein LOC131026477 [Salvia miltiorrhiza]|uniref:uncharacterized protein LOC131026477 n=1 Tax=Salvia miltiorrhiza TaxID=226208 RepID=UPI0025AD944F|nr:uncharacterized protein LOC131026477 [Salvia miltiorrhiza]